MKFLRRLARKRFIAQNKHSSTYVTPKGHTLGAKPYTEPPAAARKFTASAPSTYQFVDLAKDKAMPEIWDQGQFGACHDDQTEFLTKHGWISGEDLSYSSLLATVDPDSGKVSYELPTNILKLPWNGELYRAQTANLDFAVTPNHRMLVHKWDESARTLSTDYSFVTAENLGWYSGFMGSFHIDNEHRESYVIPGVKNQKIASQREDRVFPMKEWLQFLGLYIAEGTMLQETRNGRITNKIQIAAVKDRERFFAERLFEALGIKATSLADRYTFCNKQIYEHLESLGLKGVKAFEKFVPNFVFEQSKENIEYFLEGHRMGDGHEFNGQWTHYTSSPRLVDDLQRLIHLSGGRGNIYSRLPRESRLSDGRIIRGTHPEYSVRTQMRKTPSLDRKESLFTEHYDGMVYCAEVPTYHTLVTRRNGKILVSGNCTAFSTMGVYTFVARKEGLKFPEPSQMFAYYESRYHDGDPNKDGGSTNATEWLVASNIGVVPLTKWAYNRANLFATPPASVVADAANHRSLQDYQLDGSQDAIQSCLTEGYPLNFSIILFPAFENAPAINTGIVPMPDPSKHQTIGGHSMAIVGIGYGKDWIADGQFKKADPNTLYVKVRNSWGKDYFQNGYLLLPFDYLGLYGYQSDYWTARKVS